MKLIFCPIYNDEISVSFLHILMLCGVGQAAGCDSFDVLPNIQRRHSTCILTHSYSTVCGVGHVADCASFDVLPNLQRRHSTCILTHSYSTVCGVGHAADCASFDVLPNTVYC
jgi:hypothetical protein